MNNDEGGNTERVVRMVERLYDDVGGKLDDLNKKLDTHAAETRERWDEHRDEHKDHELEHRSIDKMQMETISSLKAGNEKFSHIDRSHGQLEQRIEEARKERSVAIYWILGLIGTLFPLFIAALWNMRGTLDEKAEKAALEKKADADEVKEVRKKLDDIHEMLFRILPPKGDRP